jgi:hypothetical protein
MPPTRISRDGVTRTVLLIGRWAIKVPSLRYSWRLFLRGLLSNMNERDLWNWSGAAGWEGPPRWALARVVFCAPGGWLLVMERADRVADESELDVGKTAEFYRKHFEDFKPDNVGVFSVANGHQYRMIDYGEGWTVVEAEHERRGTLGSPLTAA